MSSLGKPDFLSVVGPNIESAGTQDAMDRIHRGEPVTRYMFVTGRVHVKFHNFSKFNITDDIKNNGDY